MESLLFAPPVVPPHIHPNATLFPQRAGSAHHSTMAGRKRKAEDNPEDFAQDYQESRESSTGRDADDRMSASPANSPAIMSQSLPQLRSKRPRPNVSGRALPLPRLLETLDARQLRDVLRTVCDRHPDIGAEVVRKAPRPTVTSALATLDKYEAALRAAFPFGGNPASNYAYDRVHHPLMDLLSALGDFTPHFLPPNEVQTSITLSFLDAATEIIHRLPAWDDNSHNHHKSLAYEEISKAWALVIREAAKRGGGIQLRYGGWDEKLSAHNEQSHGKMQSAVNELSGSLGWLDGGPTDSGDAGTIRQQLLAGTYGVNLPVRVGSW
ncbi:MAG: Tethering factor for nuclear proteasome sts1 [Caeruleum heppii]|nr:MAG: Tethering factor for nuclear proteasome sts1 [Caeruleum heppii]